MSAVKVKYFWKQFKRWGARRGMTQDQLEELKQKKKILLSEVIARESCRCFYCTRDVNIPDENTAQQDMRMATLDHIVPYSVDPNQDPFDPNGYHVACQKCNIQRGNKTIEEFLKDPRFIKRRNMFVRERECGIKR